MKALWANSFFRSRYLLAVIAGCLLTAAFPNLSIAGFAWIAPGLMVAAALGKGGGAAFRIGFVAGLSHYLTMIYWLLLIPYRWHGVPFGPALGWLALSAYLALFTATWVWLLVSPNAILAENQEGPGDGGVLSRSWTRRTLWAISGAAVWVAMEMGLTRILGGFPWDLLGVSQYHLVPLIQIASVTGVYGVSFLVVWASLALLSAGLTIVRRPTARSVWVGEVFLPVIVMALCFNAGLRQLRQEPPPGRTLKTTLVQPSIPQTLIWDSANDAQRFRDLLRLSEQALTIPTDVLIWPESALPKMLRYDKETYEAVTGLARQHRVWMLICSDDAERRPGATNSEDADFFNSSFLISPEGRIEKSYRKRNLVIFGEFVPLQHWLPFLGYFTPIQGGFTPGTHPVQFELGALDVKTSALICFEDVFPQLARHDVRTGTDLLVNLTNDGWFGEGAAQWQQAVTGLFRAVENRAPLIRCCNNGLTCWVDAYGRLQQFFRDTRGTIYGPGFMLAQVPLPASGEGRPLTFYTRHGDWFAWICVGIAVGMLLCRVSRKLRSRRQNPKRWGEAPAEP